MQGEGGEWAGDPHLPYGGRTVGKSFLLGGVGRGVYCLVLCYEMRKGTLKDAKEGGKLTKKSLQPVTIIWKL